MATSSAWCSSFANTAPRCSIATSDSRAIPIFSSRGGNTLFVCGQFPSISFVTSVNPGPATSSALSSPTSEFLPVASRNIRRRTVSFPSSRNARRAATPVVGTTTAMSAHSSFAVARASLLPSVASARRSAPPSQQSLTPFRIYRVASVLTAPAVRASSLRSVPCGNSTGSPRASHCGTSAVNSAASRHSSDAVQSPLLRVSVPSR